METNTNTTTRIRIEDMTLGEIKKLKAGLEHEIIKVIHEKVSAFRNVYDCGDIGVCVNTDILEAKTGHGEFIVPSHVQYYATVHFSKEDI